MGTTHSRPSSLHHTTTAAPIMSSSNSGNKSTTTSNNTSITTIRNNKHRFNNHHFTQATKSHDNNIIIPQSISSLLMDYYYYNHQRSVTLCEGDIPPPPPPPPPGTNKPPPPPPPSSQSSSTNTPSSPNNDIDSIENIAMSVSSFPNPGPFEQAMMSGGKSLVSLDSFDGFRCDISKQLSPYMAVFHSFWLGTTMLPDGKKSTYTFMTQVANDDGLLMSRVDPSRGSFDGRIHRSILGGIALGKLQIGCSAEGGPNDQILSEIDFGANTWTGNLKYGSMGGGIVYGCNYFQSITPNLAMGGEGMYISANQNLLSTYTLRYQFQGRIDRNDNNNDTNSIIDATKSEPQQQISTHDKPGASTICMNFNTAQSNISINYKRCITPGRVTLGGELQCNPFTFESQILFGTEFKLQRSKINFCIDGNTGRIQSTVETKLGMAHGSPTLNFSADINHFTDEMRFGYGINIEG